MTEAETAALRDVARIMDARGLLLPDLSSIGRGLREGAARLAALVDDRSALLSPVGDSQDGRDGRQKRLGRGCERRDRR